MNTNEKLEIFRKLCGLGLKDIETVFEGSDIKDHLCRKYKNARENHGFYGNFAFLFSLDNENASRLLSRIGFDSPS